MYSFIYDMLRKMDVSATTANWNTPLLLQSLSFLHPFQKKFD
jgi:hypothetical protein